MLPTAILLLILAALLGSLLLTRRWLARCERKLGYPRNGENFDDVKLLVLLQQDIFALRCYRRIHPKAKLSEAKYIINKLKTDLANAKAQSVRQQP